MKKLLLLPVLLLGLSACGTHHNQYYISKVHLQGHILSDPPDCIQVQKFDFKAGLGRDKYSNVTNYTYCLQPSKP